MNPRSYRCVSESEKRIDYLSVQVERLIELQDPFPSPMATFRKVALLCALTFEEEAWAQKLLGAVQAFNNGNVVDIQEGLLSFPEETVELFDEYSAGGKISTDQVKDLLNTVVSGGDEVAQKLINAWEIVQSEMKRKDVEHR